MTSEAPPRSSRAPSVRRSHAPGSRGSSASPRAEADSESGLLGALRSLVPRAHMLLPGAYAWVATVATPANQRGADNLARVVAMAALVCLVAGPILGPERQRLARVVGVWAFVGMSVLTWVMLGPLISVQKMDPVRAALGGVGWALFAFGWGSVRELDRVPEEDPRAIAGDPLDVRKRLPAGASVVLGLASVGAIIPVFLAWRVVRPGHALFAHAAAVVCAIALLEAGARIAVDRGKHQPVQSPRARMHSARPALALLAVLFGVGLVVALLR